MKYRFGPPTEDADDFAGVVARAGDLHTLTRSTVPLLAWWRDYGEQHAVPGVDLSGATARFEYAVRAGCPECGGVGKDSFTDVMVLVDRRAIAFEAKYTEPAYEPVDKWRAKGASRDNRERVLAHWCHLIETHTRAPIDRSSLGPLIYQMVHRTASACAAAPTEGIAAVAYLIFDDGQHRRDYETALTQVARVLDPASRISFSTIRVPTRRGEDFEAISGQCDEALDQDQRVDIIGEALISKSGLYEFSAPHRTDLVAR